MLSINFSKVSTKDLDYLTEQTIALSEVNHNPEVIDSVLFKQLKTIYAEYNQVVIKKTFSGLGEDLRKLDLLRDRLFLSFCRIVNGLVAFDGTPRQEPAQLLQKIAVEAGKINGLSYSAESVVLNKLIEKLSAPEAQSAIDAIGINEEVLMFTNTQKEFDALYTQQVDANSDLRQQSSASAMRKELEKVLRSYYVLVSAMRNIEAWKDIYSDLTELLKKF